MAVIHQSGAEARSELGQGGTVWAVEQGLFGADVRGRGAEDSVGSLVDAEISDGSGVDVGYDAFVLGVGDDAVLEVGGQVPGESGLKGLLPVIGSGSRRHGHVGMGWMVGSEGASEGLGAQHVEVVLDGEDLCLCMQVVGVGHI